MSEESVRKLLKDVGVTEKETEVYIFLARHGALKGSEIAKQTKKHKAQIYNILKNLQGKGLVETTLEFPTRFTAVPIEKVIDLNLKAKHEEAATIENARKEILAYWKTIGQAKSEVSLEKFVVIEGSNKIFARLGQMMNETKNQFSTYMTVPDLLSAYNFGLFESSANPMPMNSQFRAVIEFGEQELTILKNFLRKKHITNFDLRGKNPSLGLGISPRMAVKDEDEVMLFVTHRNATKAEQDDVCLWTNCRTLVLSFLSVFRDIWRNAPNIEEKVTEMKASQVVPRAFDIGNTENARLTYDKVVQSAENEVLIVTSANGLASLAKRFSFFKELASKGVQVKILAPITPENYVITQELLEICDVRNIATDYAETTLVDGQHLFQFDYQPVDHHYEDLSHFENMTYIIDFEYLKKTKVAFTDLWTNALLPPSNPTKKPINDAPKQVVTPPEEKRWSEYSKVMNQAEGQIGGLTEKDVLDKIIKAKRKPAKTWSDPILFYGSHASAVIHPPYYFNLPNMMLSIYHNNKQSSFGDEDLMIISLWLETPKGHAYVPVALVTDNPEGSILRKKVWEHTPVANNYQIVKKDEFEVRVQSNTLFAGWTAPILLVPSKYMLPPACILFEGYGKLVSGASKTVVPSGRKVTTEYNGLEAFVTFFHPSSKYSGPGTDGLFARDAITSSVP